MKSYQVLLPRWLERPVKKRVEQLNVSFSEVLRVQVCLAVLALQKVMHPNYKPAIELEDFLNKIKSFLDENHEKNEILELYSDIYYETRKALEYREKQEKKAKKNK
jgi:ubiquitin-protein ligase